MNTITAHTHPSRSFCSRSCRSCFSDEYSAAFAAFSCIFDLFRSAALSTSDKNRKTLTERRSDGVCVCCDCGCCGVGLSFSCDDRRYCHCCYHCCCYYCCCCFLCLCLDLLLLLLRPRPSSARPASSRRCGRRSALVVRNKPCCSAKSFANFLASTSAF